jgi:RNA polymerase sigma-70 factor (ECF subfamily)
VADRTDIDDLFRLYYRPLCLYAARFLHDADAVEDIVQASFVTLWERTQASGQEPDSPKAYLYRMVHNRCIDALRQAGPDAGISVEQLKEDVPDEETMDRSFVWARLWTAIDALPPKRREILLLNKRDGLSYAEIAQRMGISESTVHNQLTKAMQTLRIGADQVFFKIFLW